MKWKKFSSKKLSSVTTTDNSSANDKSPIGILQDEKAAHMIKMKKMENEMEEVFKQKVEEKKEEVRAREDGFREGTGEGQGGHEEERTKGRPRQGKEQAFLKKTAKQSSYTGSSKKNWIANLSLIIYFFEIVSFLDDSLVIIIH